MALFEDSKLPVLWNDLGSSGGMETFVLIAVDMVSSVLVARRENCG